MSAHDHGHWTGDHVFLGERHTHAETRTRFVVALAATFMVVEIAAGIAFGSMALLADGVHMATHVGALGLAAAAYALARRYAKDARFSFGSGKFGDLAAFASALILGMVSVLIAVESVFRFSAPRAIDYEEALVVAVVGLLVNIVSAYALHEHEDDHDHDHDHDHGQHHSAHRDNNLSAAYVHVVTDALTSLLAIAALIGAGFFDLPWLDAAAGLLGAIVIAIWAARLLRDSGRVLLDMEDNPHLAADIRGTLEKEAGAHVADLHLWRVGPGHRSLIVSLIAPAPCSTESIKDLLHRRHAALSHVTVEIVVCADCAPKPR